MDKERPYSLYYIGIYYHRNKNYKLAYNYFKRGYKIGYPINKQTSLKPTLSYYFLPKCFP
jgi:lipoprotein NlpI